MYRANPAFVAINALPTPYQSPTNAHPPRREPKC